MKFFCLVLALLVSILPAHAGTLVIQHQGATDPLAEGFTYTDDGNTAIPFPIINDLGFDAWALPSNHGYPVYRDALSTSELADAAAFGWRLSLREHTVGAATASFKLANWRWDINVSDTQAWLSTGQIFYTVAPYDLLELVAAPGATSADFFVNGILTFSGDPGRAYPGPAEAIFGTWPNSQGNVNLYRFEIGEAVPEPAACGLLFGGLTILAAWRVRLQQGVRTSSRPTTTLR